MSAGYILLITFAIIGTFAGYMTVVMEGYPANPFKWRSERRRRLSKERLNRIKALEHDLGYRPCSDDKCRSCNTWDQQLQDRKIKASDELVRMAYDKSVDMAFDMHYDYANRSYVVTTKRDGMAMKNEVSEQALREFERENYALMKKIASM